MGSCIAVFRSAFALAGGRSERLPRTLVRHALRPFAPFATVPLRRCVDERDGRFKTGHVRHSFFRCATAPLTFRGRGALGVGVLFFLLYYFLLLWFYSTLMVLSSFVQAYKGWWRFAQRRSTTFTRCDFTPGTRLAPRLSRRRRGGCAGSARAPVRAGRRCRDGCRFRWCRCPRGRA